MQGFDVEVEQKSESTLNDKVMYYSLKAFLSLTAIMPKSLVYGFMKTLTLSFYTLSKRRREITQDNIQKSFPKLSTLEVKTLSKEVFIELSKTISEILLLITERFDIDDAIENREEALVKLKNLRDAHPEGWVFMTAHFSNWELGAHFLAKYGYAALAIGREGDNKMIDQKIVTPFRQKYGNGSIYKKNAAIAVFKALKRGEIVGILLDQKVNDKEGIKVTFFDRDVYTTSLVATMKKKLDITVVPVFLPRMPNGKYTLLVGDPIENNSNIKEMTQSYNDSIEKIVREYPSQWFWMHNRWKV